MKVVLQLRHFEEFNRIACLAKNSLATLWVGLPFRTAKQEIRQLKIHGADCLTKGSAGLVCRCSGRDFQTNGLDRTDCLPIGIDRLLRSPKALQDATCLPMPPVECFGCSRLPGHHNGMLCHTERFPVPALLLIEFSQMTPGIGRGSIVAKLISHPSCIMKHLIGREGKSCLLF